MASLSAHNALDDCSALHQVLKEVVKQQLTDGEGNTADIEQTLWTQLMTSYLLLQLIDVVKCPEAIKSNDNRQTQQHLNRRI